MVQLVWCLFPKRIQQARGLRCIKLPMGCTQPRSTFHAMLRLYLGASVGVPRGSQFNACNSTVSRAARSIQDLMDPS